MELSAVYISDVKGIIVAHIKNKAGLYAMANVKCIVKNKAALVSEYVVG